MNGHQLFLMRHGKAQPARAGQRDHERALAIRGLLNATDQAREFPPKPGDGMLVSDALRTRQTADALMSTWAGLGTPEPSLPNRRDTPNGYLASAGEWLELISMEQEHRRLWIVGHNPGISELVTDLTGDCIAMTTADIVEIALDISAWMDIVPNCGEVVRHRTGRGA